MGTFSSWSCLSQSFPLSKITSQSESSVHSRFLSLLSQVELHQGNLELLRLRLQDREWLKCKPCLCAETQLLHLVWFREEWVLIINLRNWMAGRRVKERNPKKGEGQGSQRLLRGVLLSEWRPAKCTCLHTRRPCTNKHREKQPRSYHCPQIPAWGWEVNEAQSCRAGLTEKWWPLQSTRGSL